RVLPLRVKLPFQTVETVNEATPQRRTLFSAQPEDHPWRNRLIWGDKKYVLPALLDEFAGKSFMPRCGTRKDEKGGEPGYSEERRRSSRRPSPNGAMSPQASLARVPL